MTNESAVRPSDVVGERVREARLNRRLTAKQLAERCAAVGAPQLSAWTIMNIENGRRDPTTGRRRRDVTVDELLALAVALEVSPLDLVVPPYPAPQWTGQLGAVRDGEPHYYAADVPAEPVNSPNDDEAYHLTPTVAVPMWRARQYLRGSRPLDGQDPWVFYAERPLHERPTERLGEGSDDDGRR